jgi:hypothetical protein
MSVRCCPLAVLPDILAPAIGASACHRSSPAT